MKNKRIVYLDGRLIEESEAKIPILNPGFLLGFALFETMRSCNNKIVYFPAHIERLKNSARALGIEFLSSESLFRNTIKNLIRINKLQDAAIRLTLWKNECRSGVLVSAKKYRPYPVKKYQQGFSAQVSGFRQSENSFFSQIKSTNRILYELSLQEARAKGFDEAVILNNRGCLAEGSRSNIFFVKDGAIFTPDLECGCLPGITRKVVFDLARRYRIKIFAGCFTLQDLLSAQEAFFTSSLMGIMPLTSIGKEKIAEGRAGKLTGVLLKKYLSLLKK